MSGRLVDCLRVQVADCHLGPWATHTTEVVFHCVRGGDDALAARRSGSGGFDTIAKEDTAQGEGSEFES